MGTTRIYHIPLLQRLPSRLLLSSSEFGHRGKVYILPRYVIPSTEFLRDDRACNPRQGTDHQRVNAVSSCDASASHASRFHCTQVDDIQVSSLRPAIALPLRRDPNQSRAVLLCARESFTSHSAPPSIAIHFHTATRCAPSRQPAKRRR